MAPREISVAAQYQSGQVLTLGPLTVDEDLSDETTADLVVTLAYHLGELAEPDRFGYVGVALKVGVLWREVSRRGVVLY